MRFVANIVLFYLGWLACVWQGGLLALVATGLLLAVHFYFIVEKQDRRLEWQLIASVLLVGVVVELLVVNTGALVPAVDTDILAISSWFPPIWLLCLWVIFATTLRHSLSWLQKRTWLGVILAALSAPSSYYAGSLLSPYMSLGSSLVVSLVVIGVLWAIAFPLIMRFLVKEAQPYASS